MLTVEEALAAILAKCSPLGSELIELTAALGRVLAENVKSDMDLPPFTNSAVDGYAVCSADIECASSENPVAFPLTMKVEAGGMPDAPLRPSETARVLTGAPLPDGADAMVMQEDVEVVGGMIRFSVPVQVGSHIRVRGGDIEAGVVACEAGSRIRSAEIALLTSIGRNRVLVHRRPLVAVFSTGNEVVTLEQGVLPPPGKLRNSNLPALEALVREAGGVLHSADHLLDDLDQTMAALQRAADTGADVIVTSGGVSVGDRDFVKPALEKVGTLDLWRVAMKPGKPVAFGSIGKTLFFGLPGNPVSTLVTFELFVRPVLQRLAGYSEETLKRWTVVAKTQAPISHTPGRREYVRAHLVQNAAGDYLAMPTGAQGSGILRSFTGANALLVVGEREGDIAEGSLLTAILL